MSQNSPLTVVVWKWGDLYSWDHVARLYNGVMRHLHVPFEMICITDDVPGCVSNVPHVGAFPLLHTDGIRNCRRLWIFSDEARALGQVILQLDLDMVITDDITPIIQSFGPCDKPKDFVRTDKTIKIWKCNMSSRYRFGLNPSLMMLKTGVHFGIWDEFIKDPDARLLKANRNGWPASDQAIISDTFTRPTGLMTVDILVPVWTAADGVLALRDEPLRSTALAPHQHIHDALPPSTRIVSFHGRFDPKQYTQLDWVKEHWLL